MASQPTLAECLIAEGADRAKVESAAREFYEPQFGEYLVELGIVTRYQLLRALARQSRTRGNYIQALRYLDEAGALLHVGAVGIVTELRLAKAGGKP